MYLICDIDGTLSTALTDRQAAALVIDDHPAVCSRLAALGYQVLEVK